MTNTTVAPDTIRVGDTVRVTTTYPTGEITTHTFAVSTINEQYIVGERVGAYFETLEDDSTRTWEILERALPPEPQGIGAVITDGDPTPDKWVRVGPDEWRIVTKAGALAEYRGVNWEGLVQAFPNLAVLSEGVAL